MGRKFFAMFGLFVLVSVLGGCSAGSVKLDGASVSKIQNKRLALVVTKRPKLIIVTPAKGMLSSGLMASLVMRGLSDDLARDFSIADPAQRIGQQIQQQLVAKHAMLPAPSVTHADVHLQVTTTGWQVMHGSLLNMMSYHPMLSVNAQLIDARTKKVLSQGGCNYGKAVTKTHGYEEILANNGALLKADLDQMTALCAREILAKAF